MRKETGATIGRAISDVFDTKGDFRYTGMTLGFRHDDGWFDILWRLCGDLEPSRSENPTVACRNQAFEQNQQG
jgi:hypothetical protein